MTKQCKRVLTLLLAMAMVLVHVPAPVFAVDNVNLNGDIEIRTIEDLYNIRNNLDANYILMNDIDLTEATAKGGDWDFDGHGWNPIGSDDIYGDTPFTGTFNGNGHRITGMRIEIYAPGGAGEKLYGGLFAKITGSVTNLSVVDAVITGHPYRNSIITGVLAGEVLGTIQGISVSGSISVISENKNNIHAGGIAGRALSANVSDCRSNVAIDVDADQYGYAGGLFALASGTIERCFSTGDIVIYAGNGGVNASGLAGSFSNAKVTIRDSYNTGDITATTGYSNYYSRDVSGICEGYSGYTEVVSCYNAGKVNVGYAISDQPAENCYYLSGAGSSSSGAAALTDVQMKLQSVFKGFDFESVWTINPYANYPYPQLKSNIQDLSESAELVSILALPAKTEYFTGDKLDFTGAMVKVVYISGREEIINITDEIVADVDMNTAGQKTVTVMVAGASDTYTIQVKERPVVSAVTIILEPDTKVFTVGTAFDFTGAKAKISYVGGATEYKDIAVEETTGGNIHHVGKQTITYTFGGKSATFVVEVVSVALQKIELTSLPNKIAYLEGQALDLTGMVVTAVMNNGIENTVGTGYTVSGYSSAPGTYTVTVTYLGKTAQFEVTVAKKQLVSLRMNTLPDKLEYIAGQAFDGTGMQLVATYDNGDVEVVEDYSVSGLDDTPGIKNIVVSVDGQSVSFPAKVVARVVTGFALVSLPSKREYIEYEAFDPTGMKAEATYNDGITQTVTDYTLAGFSSKPGTHTIMVAYEGFVESFEIQVIPRVLEDVTVSTPNKVAYYIGEEFDPAGMEVIACYNNGQRIAVDDYKVSGFESNTAGAKTISVTYGGFTRSFAIAVQARSVVEANGSFLVDDLVGRLGEEVRLPVTVTSNTGIAGLRHEISFDAANLKFVGVEMQGDYAKGTVIFNGANAANGNAAIVWFSGEDVAVKGLVYELVFQIQETAADGVTEVRLDFKENDHGNISGENVVFGKQDGSVEVRSYWLGDMNGDRKCAMVDIVMLAQYVAGYEMTLTEKQLLSADVNEDGTCDIHDVILLNQWLLAADI